MTIRLRLLTILALALTALPCCAQDKEAGAGHPKLGGIDERMQHYVDAQQTSGVVTLVARDGQIVHLSAVGQADIAAGQPMRTDSLFAIASMTKPISAAALMILVDEGKVKLDDPVSKYIPAFKNAKLKDGAPLKREIIVRDLLRHTSGLGGDQQNQGTLAETADKLAARGLDFQPGERWQYSPGLNVIGRIVEVASGQDFDKFLAERIFNPLGMHDTTFNPTAKQQLRVVKLYQPSADKKSLAATTHWINDTTSHREPNPSGGLFSTAEDLAKFYQMCLDGGTANGKRIMSEKALQEMTTLQTGDLKTGFTDGNGWGLGFCLVREPQGVSQSLSPGSFGHGGAFGTQGWIDPAKKMIYVLLIQRTGFGNSDGAKIRGDLHDAAVSALEK
jgi:CubicO group peptidase (beta-lactamase class C family)